MYPKSDIHLLERRREYHRRLRFLRHRMRELPFEYQFAMGDRKKVPRGIEMPPEWVLNAVRWIGARGFRVKIPTAAETERDPRGVVKDTIAFYEALRSYASIPSDEKGDDAEMRRLNKKLSQTCQKFFSKELPSLLRKLENRMDDLLPAPTPKQLHAYNRRQTRIANAVVDEDGEYKLLASTQAEATYIVWVFWKDLGKQLPSMTAQKLHGWFGKKFGFHTSLKTVEVVYTRLNLAAMTALTPPISAAG